MFYPPIPAAEALEVEFKSDRDCLNDDDLIEALICLANANGGSLYLGVENDATVTGLHPSRPANIAGLAPTGWAKWPSRGNLSGMGRTVALTTRCQTLRPLPKRTNSRLVMNKVRNPSS